MTCLRKIPWALMLLSGCTAKIPISDGPSQTVDLNVSPANDLGFARDAQGPPSVQWCKKAPNGALPAFFGAEGFGAYAEGGRGGAVYFVTNTRDEGPGSLRAAIDTPGKRTVIFRAGGTIVLKSMLVVRHPYLTIAGQTAPGGGMMLRRGGLIIATHDVVVRNLRIRVGDESGGPASNERDGISISSSKTDKDIYNVIIDHCSVSWGVDENFSTWTNKVKNVTIQWSIVAEALRDSIHVDEGASNPAPHSMGMLLGENSSRISIHHNLMAHNDDRNPYIKGIEEAEFINNIIYNYKSGPTKVSDDLNTAHLVNNYYRLGVDSREDMFLFGDSPHSGSKIFLSGNMRHPLVGNPTQWSKINGDNSVVVSNAIFAGSNIVTVSASAALDMVLSNAGATRPARDSVDERIVDSVKNRSGKVIDSPTQVGGWPSFEAGSPPIDSDMDGIADTFEKTLGLNEKQFDSDKKFGDGCTALELYLASLM